MADNYGSWGTDIGHDGDAQPMKSLKGGMSEVHTQMPMQGENQENARGQSPDPWAGWTGFLADTGGSRGVGGNDSRTKST